MIKKLKYGLTRRELEVLQRLILGQSYASTARALEIGLGTVQTHVKSLYRKLWRRLEGGGDGLRALTRNIVPRPSRARLGARLFDLR